MLELVLRCCLAVLGAVVPEPPAAISTCCIRVELMGKLVEGRVLGCFVHEGMNEDEVRQVLGRPDVVLRSEGPVCYYDSWLFHFYRVFVYFGTDGLVRSVTFPHPVEGGE